MGICITCEKDVATECQCGKIAQAKIVAARQRRDAGITEASDHADAVSPGWTELAVDALIVFLSDHGHEPFLFETFVEWTRSTQALLEPPDGRAWGAVTTMAQRRGLIEKSGAAPAATSNLSLKWLWKAKAAPIPEGMLF